ncbi:MAG: ATP-binding protein [Phycisphaerales bacterium]
MMLHPLLQRHLKRAGLAADSPTPELGAWEPFLQNVSKAYTEADQDRYLLERSLSLSSQEMRDLHQMLADERDALKTVIVSLAEGLCVLDNTGAVQFMNPVATHLLGLDDRQCVGKQLQELVTLKDSQGRTISDILADPASSASSPSDELRLIVGDKEAPFIVFSASPMGGENAGMVLTLRDITERKRHEKEREELNRQLVATSRQAGMAEIATGVLHNVGNVLNSVNVSATLADEKIRASKVSGVAKAASLLQTHAKDLAAFLSVDPTGRQLPQYLSCLAEQLATEQRDVLGELESLRQNIEHIKEIVSTQQTYAKNVGVREMESLEELAEDAIRMCSEAARRHGIRIERQFEACPPVRVDKHHVLQILINLINNAKHAVSPCTQERRSIVVRLGRDGSDSKLARLQVIDKGVGIAPENITRIFQHGFTTRKDGHGFGLHSAANAAKTFGATLSAQSDGPDRGATFTLDVPLEKEESKT